MFEKSRQEIDALTFKKLDRKYKGSMNQTFLCQVESEEGNLDGYLINALENNNGIDKLAIDHLTGG